MARRHGNAYLGPVAVKMHPRRNANQTRWRRRRGNAGPSTFLSRGKEGCGRVLGSPWKVPSRGNRGGSCGQPWRCGLRGSDFAGTWKTLESGFALRSDPCGRRTRFPHFPPACQATDRTGPPATDKTGPPRRVRDVHGVSFGWFPVVRSAEEKRMLEEPRKRPLRRFSRSR